MSTIAEIATSAADRLRIARIGQHDMDDPQRVQSGLYNAVVFGRMVTFALQNLSSKVLDFDQWYEPVQERMRADPLMKYFHGLRNRIEKQTGTPTVDRFTATV